ncbi:MAG TPA: HEPN domain-containing protein [Solirubrobacterales bacterium]|jgi:hypothetical protein|nr:HEPN domain-containing protein [Solirubrobacterales bacterium]
MRGRARPHIEADGTELDSAYFLTDNEYVSGFLRLPTATDVGRMRFLEDVPPLASDHDVPTLPPVPITLLDGKGGGTDACLLGSFVSWSRFSAPLQPQYPLALTVNAVLVGSADGERAYDRAVLRCPQLLEFLDISGLTLERAVELGSGGTRHASAKIDALCVELREGVEIREKHPTEQALRWYGEIYVEGQPRRLEDWAEPLADQLALFALLADQPFRPGRIYTDSETGRVEFYATWPEAEAPRGTEPLFLLPEIAPRFEQVVAGWSKLLTDAHDLVDHLIDFQIHREHLTAADQLLSLARCLELCFDHGDRFDSTHRPSGEHRALVEEALGHFPTPFSESHGAWIRESLLASNRKRLAAQLEAVLDDLGPEVCGACQIEDPATFAGTAKDARNHYTHPTGPPKASVPKGRDLIICVNRLWFLARAAVLVELGFERCEVAAALRRSSRHYLLR